MLSSLCGFSDMFRAAAAACGALGRTRMATAIARPSKTVISITSNTSRRFSRCTEALWYPHEDPSGDLVYRTYAIAIPVPAGYSLNEELRVSGGIGYNTSNQAVDAATFV